jgi:hypothetical protein
MATRKCITKKGNEVKWSVLVRSSAMNGYYYGTAKSIADAESQIDRFLDSIGQNRKAA